MRPFLHRGQAPAAGILHVGGRDPARTVVDTDGKAKVIADPRGYWLGQHTNKAKAMRRAMIRAMGRRQTLKRVKEARRG